MSTIRFLSDENFDRRIIVGLKRRDSELNIITVYEAGLNRMTDDAVLQWAADDKRIVLTHDVTTMTGFAKSRIARNLPMPGLIEIHKRVSIATAIEEILTIATCSSMEEWEGQICFLPL